MANKSSFTQKMAEWAHSRLVGCPWPQVYHCPHIKFPENSPKRGREACTSPTSFEAGSLIDLLYIDEEVGQLKF